MNGSFRIGHGYDIHRLAPGGKLVLGGVVVSEQFHAQAHSDGDVAIHAIVDAILGALGRGDIGEHFPDSDPAYKNASSMIFLDKMRTEMRSAGYRLVNVDLTILAQRPRLKNFKPMMAARLQEALGAPVNVKAGTNEGCDDIGRGLAIAAHAVVLLCADA